MEFSLVILTSEFASGVGFLLSETLFLTVFLCLLVLAAVGAYRVRPRIVLKRVETCVLVIVLASVVAVFKAVFPSDLPSSYGVDAWAHYAVANSIVTTQKLTGLPSWYSPIMSGLDSYPYGYHATISFLSKDLGVPLIFVFQPFNEFLIALAVCTLVFLSLDSVKCRIRYIPLVAGLAIACPYTFDLFAAGYYAQLMGIFLTLTFCLLLLSSFGGDRKGWILLSVVYAAIWLTYPYLALIPSATIFLVILVKRRRNLIVPFATMLLVSVALAFPRILWFIQRLSFYLPASSPALPFPVFIPIGALGVAGLISFLLLTKQRRISLGELVVPCLHTVVLCQAAALFLLDSVMKYGSYFFTKSGYLGDFSSIGIAAYLFREDGVSFRSILNRGRRSIIPFLILILILANFGFAIRDDNQLVAEANATPLSHPVYDAAIWINQNIPNDVPVQCIASECFWVVAISLHPPSNAQDLFQPLPSLHQWLNHTANRSVLLVAIEPGVPADWAALENNPSVLPLHILFHEENVFVLGSEP